MTSAVRRSPLALFSLLALLGCGEPTTPAPDAARADTSVEDAAASVDASAIADGGSEDAAREDAATADAAALADGGPDAGTGPGCVAEIDAIENAAAQVWFLSESDRELDVSSFAGEGTDAPTEATVVRLAASPAAATHELRMTGRFAMHFEPAPGAAPEAPADLEAAIAAGLTDLIYVAIIEDPTRSAEVRVILAGRTACGELVFIESVSIET